jgi:hypothetical protein
LVVNLISFLLAALGVAGLAAALLMQQPRFGFYSVGSELVIYALLILTGAGLAFRLRGTRTLALGWLKLGAFAFIIVPIAAVIWMMSMHQGSGPLQVIGALVVAAVLLLSGPDKAEPEPIYWVLFAFAGLAAFSYLCHRLFRYLDSDAVAAEFPPGIAATASRRFAVYACMAVYLSLAYYAQQRHHVSQSSLPRSLQTREHVERVQKARQDALSRLVGFPSFTDGGRMLMSVMGYAPFGSEVLCQVDLATGKMTRIEVASADIRDAGQGVDLPRRLSPDLPLLWLRGNEMLDLRTNQRRKMQVADEYRRFAPLGFLAGSKRFLLYDPESFRMHALDVETGAFAWSLDVTPAGGFTSEDYKTAFHGKISTAGGSALSPDRSRFVYLYLDTLYVVDTTTGTLDSQPAAGHEFQPTFSRESDWVITLPSGSNEPAALYDLKAKKRIPHGLKGSTLHFSSATGRIVGLEYRYEARTATPLLTRIDLSHPGTPRWQIQDPVRHTHAATEDGKRLYALNPDANRIEYLDLDAVTGDAPLGYTPLTAEIPVAERRFIAYSSDRRLIAVLHSPKMTIIRADAGADAPAMTLDFSAFAYRPKD